MNLINVGYPSHMREIDLIRSIREKKYSLLRLEVVGFQIILGTQFLIMVYILDRNHEL